MMIYELDDIEKRALLGARAEDAPILLPVRPAIQQPVVAEASSPATVYMVIQEYMGGNECGAVVLFGQTRQVPRKNDSDCVP